MDSKFKVDNSFWDTFPEASISVLTIKGIDNKDQSAVITRT
jgi:DNA/RNA-binding domain of Phe-tRNA-synthetase-like protein